MNREIKFRAWAKESKHIGCSHFKGTPLLQFWINYYNDPDGYNLMQYTGLKDKNGVEIYEGDILQCDTYHGFLKWWSNTQDMIDIAEHEKKVKSETYKQNGKVEFEQGSFRCFYKYLNFFVQWNDAIKEHCVIGKETKKRDTSCDCIEGWLNIEVIGNIYENPELLEN